jgi:hypothetical protein
MNFLLSNYIFIVFLFFGCLFDELMILVRFFFKFETSIKINYDFEKYLMGRIFSICCGICLLQHICIWLFLFRSSSPLFPFIKSFKFISCLLNNSSFFFEYNKNRYSKTRFFSNIKKTSTVAIPNLSQIKLLAKS